MTLFFGSLAALVCGRLVGRRWPGIVVVGLVWYAGLAFQTALLAQPGRTGPFGIDGPGAVRGEHFAQYWLSQVLIAVVIVGLYAVGVRWRARARRAARV